MELTIVSHLYKTRAPFQHNMFYAYMATVDYSHNNIIKESEAILPKKFKGYH